MDPPQLMMQGVRDGKFVVIAAQDKIIRLINMLTFMLSHRLVDHSQEVTDVASIVAHLLSASRDCVGHAMGRCLSWMKFSTPVLTMTRTSFCEWRMPTEEAHSMCPWATTSTR